MKTFMFLCMCILMMVVPSKAQDKDRVDYLNQQSDYFRDLNIDSVTYYADLALAECKNIDYVDGEIEALINVCFARYVNGHLDQAVVYCERALDIHDDTKSVADIAGAYQFLGLIKINQGKFNEAIDHFLPLIEIATKQENDFLLADVCSNIGLAYLSFKNYSKSLQYYRTALKIHKNIDYPHGLVYVNQNIGRIFFEQNQYDSASFYFNQTITTANASGNTRALFYGLLLSGQVPTYTIEERIGYLNTALDIATELRLTEQIGNIYFLITEIYDKQMQADSAIYYGLKSEVILKEFHDFENLLKLYYFLTQAYTIKDKQDSTVFFADLYSKTLDSLNETRADYLTGVIDANEMMEDERSYEMVKDRLDDAEAKIQQKNIILIGTGLGLMLVAAILVIVFRVNRQKAKSNKILQLLNEKLDTTLKEKDILLGMIVHDLRSPLSKIQGLLEIFKGAPERLDQSQLELIGMMEKILGDTKGLTEELLEVNRLESKNVNKKESAIDVRHFIDDIVFHYTARAEEKGIHIDVKYNLAVDEFVSDKFMLQRIIENLLSNAIKFNSKDAKVGINVFLTSHEFTISIKDNGPGIDVLEQDRLFKKFGKTTTLPTDKETSTGLGLYISKSLVESLNGRITVQSQLGKGAEFTVDIPH